MHLLYHSYEDMTKGMAIIELRIKSYEKRKALISELLRTTHDASIQIEDDNISYKDYLKEMKILDGHLLLHKEELKRLEGEKEQIDALMGKLEGTTEQVFYYRMIKGMTQEQTAEKVYLSIRQVQRIEKKIEKEIMSW